MRYRTDRDPFYTRQPEQQIMKKLNAPIHEDLPSVWNKRQKRENEIFFEATDILAGFPDEAGVLDTVYADFGDFLYGGGAKKGGYIFRTEYCEGMREEAYRILTGVKECVIQSSDTEGIRRAIYYIEDEMRRREGFYFELGEIYRYAVIKTRISRGFLTPHYSERYAGELEDDTEHYSDNYLNRLAHDGVNGIWVQEQFRAILPSKIIPEYGQNGTERVERLNRLIKRCKRYGIKVYLEGIEPASSLFNPSLKNHPELLGQVFENGNYGKSFTFCSSTKMGKEYIKESTGKLFELLPDLAGIVNISVGESVGCCGSVEEDMTCPKCIALGLSKAQVLANCERDMLEGMRVVKPDAELISWAYAMRSWKQKDMEEYFSIRDRRIVSMINFEDLGEAEQLGKVRTATDYWLSYTGPGQIFQKASEAGKERNTPVYAKIQACSSHEVSTVPYVPVPGILYDKYKYMHEHQVTGALYCWYFGNYPCMMNKAAGELAFAPFPKSKEQFLESLAGIYWGSSAAKAAQAYQYFEEGYANYPVNMAFEWHGPMGDGPAWPLHLKPVDLPVSRSYGIENMVGSDRIGEAILMGHTHEEVRILCEEMSQKWEEGVKHLKAIEPMGDYDKEEQQSVAEALGILFRSGVNILRFYELRNQLGCRRSGGGDLLFAMRNIVCDEIENSDKLEKLCERDIRLGYHCEAMGYKFFPEKLKWRIDMLKELLEEEFPEVEARIAQGQIPLPFYFGLSEENHRYVITAEEPQHAKWEYFVFQDGNQDSDTKIKISENAEEYCIVIASRGEEDIILRPEFRMFHPYVPVRLSQGKAMEFCDAASYGLFAKDMSVELTKWNVTEEQNNNEHVWTIRLKKELFFQDGIVPFRIAVSKVGSRVSEWEKGDRYYFRLILGTYSPDSYVFIIPRC